MEQYRLIYLFFIWKTVHSLKPGSNIFPNKYCARDGQYLPHPHSPCRYLRCGLLPPGLDIDDNLEKILFSAEYRCPVGYGVLQSVYKLPDNSHFSDICKTKEPLCFQDDLDIPRATKVPQTYRRRPLRNYGRQSTVPSKASVQQRSQSLANEVRTPESGTAPNTQSGNRQPTNKLESLYIPKEIAQRHPWLVQNESAVPYVAGPPIAVRYPGARPTTTEETTTKSHYNTANEFSPSQRRVRFLRQKHLNLNNDTANSLASRVPRYPPGYVPKPPRSSEILELPTHSSYKPNVKFIKHSGPQPQIYKSREQGEHQENHTPSYEYWNKESVSKYEKSGNDLSVKGVAREDNILATTTPATVAPPGAYVKFQPEDFRLVHKYEYDEKTEKQDEPDTKQMDVVDYGTYSNDQHTPWPLPVGLDDAINAVLTNPNVKKSSGMYIPDEIFAKVRKQIEASNLPPSEKEATATEDENREINDIDTGADSPMFPVPVIVRGENKASGNPLSLANLPRGYYMLMPIGNSEKLPSQAGFIS